MCPPLFIAAATLADDLCHLFAATHCHKAEDRARWNSRGPVFLKDRNGVVRANPTGADVMPLPKGRLPRDAGFVLAGFQAAAYFP